MQLQIDLLYTVKSIPRIAEMIPVTMLILLTSLGAGILIAFGCAIVRVHHIAVLEQIAYAYVTFIRGTPFIIQLFIVYYVMPSVLQYIHVDISFFTKITFAVIAFSINTGAYLSEIFRASILNVEQGQTECAYSIGMNRLECYWYILLPQALKLALPNIGSTVISLLKDTSLAFNIGIIDIMGKAKIIGGYSYRFFETYLAAAIIYWVLCILLELLFARLMFIIDREGRAKRNAY